MTKIIQNINAMGKATTVITKRLIIENLEKDPSDAYPFFRV
jgi:hypothetical protein